MIKLPRKIDNALKMEGIHSKDDLILLIKNGDSRADWIKKIPGIGKVSFFDVLKFAGFNSKKEIELSHAVNRAKVLLKNEGYTISKQ